MRKQGTSSKWIGRAIVVALAIGGLGSTQTGIARSASSGDCSAVVAQLADTDLVKIDTTKVDLGDGAYFRTAKRGSYPTASAAVCWASGRNEAYLLGKLYWGSSEAGSGGVIIQAFDAAGNAVASTGAEAINSSDGTRTVSRRVASHVTGGLNTIRLTAYVSTNGASQTVGTPVTVTFGD